MTFKGDADIERIVLHNRDRLTERLNNVHVFVSDTPFDNATLDVMLNKPGVERFFYPGAQGSQIVVPADTTGRYVRVQLDGEDEEILSLAEVEVFGTVVEEVALTVHENSRNIIDWARGKDVKDENADGNTDDNRFHMGDPLHSQPLVVNYGGDLDNPESVVFVGTNEGYLHAIDISNGEEDFAFMPQELLKNLVPQYENNRFDEKIYGMDGDLTLWTEDIEGDGSIVKDDGDHAYLYAGMRRGGSSYYALDVSDRDDPRFLFSIPENDPEAFTELGQSWSKPILSSIRVGEDEIRKVLIFAGGYDVTQDDKEYSTPDTTGRAIYIVDALDGTLHWSGQGTANPGYPTKVFPQMQFSIPSNISVVDADGDGLASQIYVGDMGGQLWRFDINNDGRTGADLVDGGVIAQLADAGSPEGARRFFHAPDLALSNFEGEQVLNIAIGSGYHAHPLNTTINDSFYVIRYPFGATGDYGVKDSLSNRFRPITMLDLYDTTDNLIGEGDAEEVERERELLRKKEGWFIRMEGSGEKVLGTSATLDHVVRFISYEPAVVDPFNCDPDFGQSFIYAVNLEDGTPYYPLTEDQDRPRTKADRRDEVPGGGLAPPVQTLFIPPQEGATATPTFVSGVNVLNTGKSIARIRRWYWSEYPE